MSPRRVIAAVQARALGRTLSSLLVYPLNVARNKWMEDVKLIIFGPSEKTVASDAEVQKRVKELQAAGVEVMECK